jgi:predicted Zn finger-like uncharacterized protein
MPGQPARESPPVITICPQCQLPLAVTAADLRIAQGQVRCGRCAAVFNALASLYEPPSAAIERRSGTTAGGGAGASPGDGGTAVYTSSTEASTDDAPLDRGAGLPPARDAVAAAPRSAVPDSTDAFEAQRLPADPSPAFAAGVAAAQADAPAGAAPDEAVAAASPGRSEPSTDAFHRERDEDAPPRATATGKSTP